LEAFGWQVERIDGHDLPAIETALGSGEPRGDRPRTTIADTMKGRGVSFMEEFAKDDLFYKFHSGAPADEVYLRAAEELLGTANRLLADLGAHPLTVERSDLPPPPNTAGTQRMVAAYSRALLREAE